MIRKVLWLDPEKCTGCWQCMLACSFVKEGEFNLSKSRISVTWVPRMGMNIPMVCQQCAKPVCEDVCPVRAISRDEQTGATIINPGLCIGCKMCLIVCPFGGPLLNTETGIMIKCDLCDGDPLCVKFCGYEALQYVDVSEQSTRKQAAVAGKISGIMRKVAEAIAAA